MVKYPSGKVASFCSEHGYTFINAQIDNTSTLHSRRRYCTSKCESL